MAMRNYRDMLSEIARQENGKFDDAGYTQRRREDFKLWLEAWLFSELFWRKKVKGKLYEAGEEEESIAAYAKGRILDVGSGLGNLCFILSEDPSSQVLGMEKNEVWVDLSNRLVAKLGRRNLRFVHRDLLRDGGGERFDTVIFSFMLHDIEEPTPYIDYALKVLNPEGQILIADLEITHQRLGKLEIADFQDLGGSWSHNKISKVVFFRILPRTSSDRQSAASSR